MRSSRSKERGCEGERGRKMKKEEVRDDGKRHTPLIPPSMGE